MQIYCFSSDLLLHNPLYKPQMSLTITLQNSTFLLTHKLTSTSRSHSHLTSLHCLSFSHQTTKPKALRAYYAKQ